MQLTPMLFDLPMDSFRYVHHIVSDLFTFCTIDANLLVAPSAILFSMLALQLM
jgi:hypothetical protein